MSWEKTQIRRGLSCGFNPKSCHLCSIPSLHLFSVSSRGCGSPASLQRLFPGHVLVHIRDNTTARCWNRPGEEGPSHPCSHPCSFHQPCAARGQNLSQANPLELGQLQNLSLPHVLGTEVTSPHPEGQWHRLCQAARVQRSSLGCTGMPEGIEHLRLFEPGTQQNF